MIDFTSEEQMLIMLYSPGTRPGLIAELTAMQEQLSPTERRLRHLTDSVLSKMELISDKEFEARDWFP